MPGVGSDVVRCREGAMGFLEVGVEEIWGLGSRIDVGDVGDVRCVVARGRAGDGEARAVE
jgi:hypothetical protein